MFKAHLIFCTEVGLRVVWFPYRNHCESNVNKNATQRSGLTPHKSKIVYLSRFLHGPFARHAGGKNKSTLKNSFALIKPKLLDTNAEPQEKNLFQDYLSHITSELKLDPERPNLESLALDDLESLSNKKGTQGGKHAKWFGDHGSGISVRTSFL